MASIPISSSLTSAHQGCLEQIANSTKIRVSAKRLHQSHRQTRIEVQTETESSHKCRQTSRIYEKSLKIRFKLLLLVHNLRLTLLAQCFWMQLECRGAHEKTHKSTKINTFFTKLLHNSNHNYPSIHLLCKKIRNIGVLALKMTVFASTPLEAEIPRFSDQNQKNSKNA